MPFARSLSFRSTSAIFAIYAVARILLRLYNCCVAPSSPPTSYDYRFYVSCFYELRYPDETTTIFYMKYVIIDMGYLLSML